MLRTFILISFAIFSLSSGLCAYAPMPTPVRNISNDILTLSLDREIVYMWCDDGFQSSNEECGKDSAWVKVAATVSDEETSGLIFRYKVSGGKIVGSGPNVLWDLTEMPPGSYSITASADRDGSRGKAISKKIVLQECPVCDRICECPSLEVSGRPDAGDRDSVIFEAVVSGGGVDIKEVRYRWRVTGGRITAGQGTKQLRVKKESVGPITATVDIGGTDPACDCSTRASSMFPRPPEPGSAIDVTLELNDYALWIPCPRNFRSGGTCSDSRKLIVAVLAKKNAKEDLAIRFLVSGGRIIGTARDPKWDLTGVEPGTHEIVAEIDRGTGFVKGPKKTVTVTFCPDCTGGVECPDISVSGPDQISSTGEQVFTVNLTGGSQEWVSYNWVVHNGEVLSGQDTPSVTVRMPQNSNDSISSVTIQIGGIDPMGSCRTEVTKTFKNGKVQP